MERENNNRPNSSEFVTISGLTPDRKALPFTVNTDQVAKFIQKKLNALQNNAEPGAESISVQMYSIDAGRGFFPFVIILGMNASEEQTKKSRNNNTDSFFTSEDRSTGNNACMKEYVYKFFKNYMYDKEDANAFNSEDWRRARGASRASAATLRSLVHPKFIKANNNNGTAGIYFLLDPLRVFHDMLRIPGDNKNFRVNINNWKKQENGVYTYNLTRVVDGKNGKGKNSNKFVDQLNYRMRSNAGGNNNN